MIVNKESDITIKKFHSYLYSILNVYQDLVPALKSELEAIQKDDIEILNESMKIQQALLLKTNHFDEKVRDFQLHLNISARNLSETIQALPEKHRLSFFEILSQFEQTSAEVKFYQEKCRILLQSKLYLIDKALSKAKIQTDHSTYNKDAEEIQGSLFTKTIEVKI